MSDDTQAVRAVGLRRDLGRRCVLANLDELRIVDHVLQRLELGRERYGHLDLSRPRNWRKERFEERLDALVYDVAEELAAEDVERARLREDARRELIAWEAHKHTAGNADSREMARDEPAQIALDDIADGEPYDAYELEDPDAGVR
jgi:hypothetical protein